jgi:hypothetical protein
MFDDVTVYTVDDLKRDPFFWPRHGEFVETRGYFGLWKPYLIRKRMSALADGDSLLYLDAGWEVTNLPLVSLADPLVGLTTNQPEGVWTKMDLLLRLKALPLADTNQRLTSAILFYVCPATRRLVNKWYALACNYHNLDDSPSKQRNLPDFREHRDHSLFSLLTKTHQLFSSQSLAGSLNEVQAVDAIVDPGLCVDR